MIMMGMKFVLLFINLNTTFICSPEHELHVSTNSVVPEGSDKFFTIDESYSPTAQNHTLVFDDVLRKTVLYYIENVNYYKRI